MTKYLECSKCGNIFKAPKMDEKYTIGYTIPGFGLVKCPSCGERTRRKNYKAFEEIPEGKTVGQPATLAKNVKSESDLIEDSKFEDE